MDLARFKKISLAEAGDALTKVEAGSYRILKSLGIQLKANATQQDALNAVEALAAGQAEAYARLNEGRLLVSQVKLGEAMENLGYVVMPVVSDAMIYASEQAQGLAAILGLLTGATHKTAEEQRDMAQQFIDAAKGWGPFMNVIANIGDAIKHTGDEAWQLAHAMTGTAEQTGKFKDDLDSTYAGLNDLDVSLLGVSAHMTGFAGNTGKAEDDLTTFHDAVVITAPALDTMGTAAKEAGDKTRDAWGSARDRMRDFRIEALKAAHEVLTGLFDPIIAKDELLTLTMEANRLARLKGTKKWTAETKAEYDRTMQDLAAHLITLGENGDTTSKEFRDGMGAFQTYAKGLRGEEAQAAQDVINQILTVGKTPMTIDDHAYQTLMSRAQAQANTLNSTTIKPKVDKTSVEAAANRVDALHTKLDNLPDREKVDVVLAILLQDERPGRHATGGTMMPGDISWVGERGPELWVPRTPGTVIPADVSSWMARAGITPAPGPASGTTNITVALPAPARPDPFEVARQLQRLNDFGVLT